MPAMLDDPDSQPVSRTSGDYPYSSMPLTEIYPRQVTLRDRITIATLVPLSSADQLPSSLVAYLCDQLNREIEKGDTYPFIEPMTVEKFGLYWFATFGAVMLLGSIDRVEDVQDGKDWSKECLGSFYIKPNYPGRSSHVCNGGFLVTDASRNRGVGRLMGEGYLEWAPMLGYTYSVFNLVYETNVASCRIWDALGFKRIGRVKGCGNLKSYPDQLIDAIIYGRDLGPEGEDFVSEERFDKIKFYLKHGKYPNGADRAEKSRLRSAATHYKLLDGDKLMLKDKEVISDPQRQYEIARSVHVQQHGGINKTTATIAEKYHWVRIKETVSLVIRNCEDCKEMAKAPVVRADGTPIKRPNGVAGQGGVSAAGRILSLPSARVPLDVDDSPKQHSSTTDNEQTRRVEYVQPLDSPLPNTHSMQDYSGIPLDPQIMEEVQSLVRFNPSAGSGQAFNDHLDSHNHPQLGGDEQTDYQALLDNGSAHAHQPNTSGFTSPDDGDVVMGDEESDKIMADKARDAARAALVGIDGGNGGDEQSREGEMKRQLELAGFGTGEETFAQG